MAAVPTPERVENSAGDREERYSASACIQAVEEVMTPSEDEARRVDKKSYRSRFLSSSLGVRCTLVLSVSETFCEVEEYGSYPHSLDSI